MDNKFIVYENNYHTNIYNDVVNLLFYSTFKDKHLIAENIVISTMTKESTITDDMEATATETTEEFLLQIKNL